MNKLQQLIEAAKAATPGPWKLGRRAHMALDPDTWEILAGNFYVTDAITCDATFIALANPATILELCALLEKAEEALNQSIVVRERLMRWRRNAWPSTDQETIFSGEYPLMDKALAAIKQWKEQT